MSHAHHHNKMDKKKPMHTAKEKRAAKRMKKQHEHDQLAHEFLPREPVNTTQH